MPARIFSKKFIYPASGALLTTVILNLDEEIVKPAGWDKIKTLDIQKNAHFHPPQNPIVLCHGLSGFSTIQILPSLPQIRQFFVKSAGETLPNKEPIEALLSIDYWHGIKKKLESNGCKVFIAKVPPYGSIHQRATLLNKYINQICEENNFQKVNLVAHSMGGLDCRYLISKVPEQNKTYKVVSLTTISTPHHGSAVADYFLEELKLKHLISDSSPSRIIPTALEQLTTEYLSEFNAEVKMDKNVSYFSYGAFFWPNWYNFFFWTWKIVFNYGTSLEDKMNDGLVSISSSKYGEYLGTLGNFDHLTLINWLDLSDRLNSWFSFADALGKAGPAELSEETAVQNFDALDFYVKICDDLGQRGM